jgi:cellobiose PTS system EIIB component
MGKRYSIAEARHNLAALVHELDQQPVIELTRRGEPVAVLLSLASYRQLLPGAGGFWAAYNAFRGVFGPEQLGSEADVFSAVRDRSPGRDVAL